MCLYLASPRKASQTVAFSAIRLPTTACLWPTLYLPAFQEWKFLEDGRVPISTLFRSICRERLGSAAAGPAGGLVCALITSLSQLHFLSTYTTSGPSGPRVAPGGRDEHRRAPPSVTERTEVSTGRTVSMQGTERDELWSAAQKRRAGGAGQKSITREIRVAGEGCRALTWTARQVTCMRSRRTVQNMRSYGSLKYWARS